MVLVAGTEAHVQVLKTEVAAALAPIGLRLSDAKTKIVHIDEGFDFLGWRIQRHRQWGSQKRYLYTYPAKKALAGVKAKVRALTRGSTNRSLRTLLQSLNRLLQGWTTYFRHGASSGTFRYLEHFTWRRVVSWLRHKHPRITWRALRRRYLPGSRWRPTEDGTTLYNTAAITITRYRYRGSQIPTPWMDTTHKDSGHAAA